MADENVEKSHERTVPSRPAARPFLFAALAALIAASSLPSHAQQSVPAEPPAISGPTEDQLKAFALASLGIEALGDEWEPRIAEAEQAGNPDAVKNLRNEATYEAIKAVQEAGLDIATYNTIYAAVKNDPEIAAQVERYRAALQ